MNAEPSLALRDLCLPIDDLLVLDNEHIIFLGSRLRGAIVPVPIGLFFFLLVLGLRGDLELLVVLGELFWETIPLLSFARRSTHTSLLLAGPVRNSPW